MRTIHLPIRLEIYLETIQEEIQQGLQYAKGLLYLDDGETFNYQKDEKTLIEYSFKEQPDGQSSILSSRALLRDCFYGLASSDILFIKEISIYGLKKTPKHVYNMNFIEIRKNLKAKAPINFKYL